MALETIDKTERLWPVWKLAFSLPVRNRIEAFYSGIAGMNAPDVR